MPLAPVVVSDTAPVSRLAEPSVMVAFEAEVVKLDVPATVRTPLCVRLPVSSVTVRLPPTFDAAERRRLVVGEAGVAARSGRGERHRAGQRIGRAERDGRVRGRGREARRAADRQDAALRQVAGLVRHRQAAADGRGRRASSRDCCSGSRCCSRRTWSSDTAPVSRLAEPSVMVAFEAEVVKLDVPATVRTPLCVRLPALIRHRQVAADVRGRRASSRGRW